MQQIRTATSATGPFTCDLRYQLAVRLLGELLTLLGGSPTKGPVRVLVQQYYCRLPARACSDQGSSPALLIAHLQPRGARMPAMVLNCSPLACSPTKGEIAFVDVNTDF